MFQVEQAQIYEKMQNAINSAQFLEIISFLKVLINFEETSFFYLLCSVWSLKFEYKNLCMQIIIVITFLSEIDHRISKMPEGKFENEQFFKF